MRCPQGIKIPSEHVLKLQRSLYGFRQTPRCWNERFHNFITNLGFVQSQSDYCLYSYIKSEYVIYLVIYVDDHFTEITPMKIKYTNKNTSYTKNKLLSQMIVIEDDDFQKKENKNQIEFLQLKF